ncbi:MAG: restriction endonuclease [Deefgea sp.]
MNRRFNSEQKRKLRWSFIFLPVISLFLLTYFLIPIWLGDDIYLSILIPHFQWLILALLGLTTLVCARLCCVDERKRRNTPSLRSDSVSPLSQPSERLKKFSFAAVSQFLAPPTWSIEFLQKLSPAQFTQMCLAYYEIKGIPHRTNRLGLARGVNILILQNDIVSKVIHCSNDQSIEMNSLRQFLGVMVHERAHAGVYIHRGRVSEEVRIFAASHNIQLRNEYACLAKIEKLSERRQQQLLKQMLN